MTGPVAGVLVALGGGVGAVARYQVGVAVRRRIDSAVRRRIDSAVRRRIASAFPWATWLVNVVGSFLLGAVGASVVAGLDPWIAVLVGTGLCGALTTFSTFGAETLHLIEEGQQAVALLSVVAGLAAGLVAYALGWWLAAGVAG